MKISKSAALICIFILVISASSGFAATLNVINNNDSGAGSLRQQIANSVNSDTIQFAPSVIGAITLTTGQLLITNNLNVLGPGANVLAIDGNNSSRIFSTGVGGAALISGLAITNGVLVGGEGGGGILVIGGTSLTLSNCVVIGNTASVEGGGIMNEGTLNLWKSTIANNLCAGGSGGGLFNLGGTAVLRICTISGNSATVSTVANGAGIYNPANTPPGTIILTNCTVAGNTAAGHGGGIFAGGPAIIAGCLVANNSAGTGPDVFGSFTSGGYNLIGKNDSTTGFINGANHDQVGTSASPIDPFLGQLQYNGGTTPTMAPASASPEIDQGNSFGLNTDQRGRSRPFNLSGGVHVGDGADIGAYEFNPATFNVTNTKDNGPGSLRQVLLNAGSDFDQINFAPGVTGTIVLTNGEIVIGKTLTVNGPGPNLLKVSGNNSSRVFSIIGGTQDVTLFNLGIVDGSSTDACIRVFASTNLYSSGSLVLESCLVASNACAGIYNEGLLQIGGSTIAYCTNTSVGGALANWGKGTIIMWNTTLCRNSGSQGGGVFFDGTSGGSLEINNSTITENSAQNGGGIDLNAGNSVYVLSTIVANNNAADSGPDVAGDFGSAGYNLIGKIDGSTGFTNGVNNDLLGTIDFPLDPRLGPLHDNGGPAPTYALLNGSPAIDQGIDTFEFSSDERNQPRTIDFPSITNAADGTDIGAYELSTSCTIDWNDVHQRIDGFGASSAFSGRTWTTAQADMLFSTNNGIGTSRDGQTQYPFTGIGLSLLRNRISSGGIVTASEAGLMQLAQARGARVWSTPWSPAITFKDSGTLDGGHFVSANYQAYADQLANYVHTVKNTYGINLYALSVQNEPSVSVPTTESCIWTDQQIHDFIPYLYQAMASNGVASTKIMIPEDYFWGFDLATNSMNDTTTSNLVGILAGHGYYSSAAPVNNYGKSLWETEVSIVDGSNDPSIDNGVYWAGQIHDYMTIAEANAFHYWWLVSLDQTGNEGLVDTNDIPAKRMYTMGNYSRFIRPNYYRIGLTGGLAVISAYKDSASPSFVIVAINRDPINSINQVFNFANIAVTTSVTPWITSSNLSLAKQTAVAVSNSSFTYTLPADSVVTFTGRANAINHPPALAPISNRTNEPGVTLVITNVASDPDLPPQILTYSLVSGPPNAVVDPASGLFTWRPPVTRTGNVNSITIQVADNWTPSATAQESFTVTVHPAALPQMTSAALNNGQFTLQINGPAGPDYALQASSNLVDWVTLFITNSPPLPLHWTDSNGTLLPAKFYRVEIGPPPP